MSTRLASMHMRSCELPCNGVMEILIRVLVAMLTNVQGVYTSGLLDNEKLYPLFCKIFGPLETKPLFYSLSYTPTHTPSPSCIVRVTDALLVSCGQTGNIQKYWVWHTSSTELFCEAMQVLMQLTTFLSNSSQQFVFLNTSLKLLCP